MGCRDLVIEQITACMTGAFAKGDIIDAQNLACFLNSLESMTDAEYDELAHEDQPGAIA